MSADRFHALVWPHRADVLRVARYLCRDPSVADDLAQETLLKAFRSLAQLADGQAARPWLLTILRRTWADRLRTRRPSASADGLVDVAAPDPADEPTDGDPRAILNAFSDQQVIDALHALPDDIRWTLLLVDVEGLSVRDAAELLGVPDGTIKSRCHRGRAMLRTALLPLAVDRRLTTNLETP